MNSVRPWKLEPKVIVCNLAIYYSIYLIIFVITNCIHWTATLGIVLFAVIGVINQFVLESRGTPIVPGDILAFRTAMDVVGEYHFKLTWKIAIALVFGIGVICLVWSTKKLQSTHAKGSKITKRLLLGVVFSCISISILYVFSSTSFLKRIKLSPYSFNSTWDYETHGTVLGFVSRIPAIKVEKPVDYSEEAVQKIVSEYSGTVTTDTQKPNLIVIMNESFSDLKELGDFDTDEDYISGWNSVTENTISGNLNVSIWGGGTALTEFEFLTGHTSAFIPSGQPYQNQVTHEIPSLCTVLEDQGYNTISMHPAKAKNWNRSIAYPLLGFNESLYIDDLVDLDLQRGGYATDASDYENVIRIFEENREEPLFLFNVTIQNHGGYEHEDYEKTVHAINLNQEYPEVDEYLSLMKQSDEAYVDLINYFKTVDEPTIILMFGDHQPKIPLDFSDEIMGTVDRSATEEENDLFYITPFKLWANYDIPDAQYDTISANYLSYILLQSANLSIPLYYNFLENVRESYPVMNKRCVRDADGTLLSLEDIKEDKRIQEYEILQYNLLIDKKINNSAISFE